MTIEKLPSGSYRIRQQHNGKRYTVVTKYKPSKAEAMRLIMDRIDNAPITLPDGSKRDFYSLALQFIQEREKDGISPSTARGYTSIVNGLPLWFSGIPLLDITQENIQKLIDEHSKNHSSKTTRNLNGFVASVMHHFRPLFNYSITLPKAEKKREYEPTTKDVQAIIELVNEKYPRYSIPLGLASIGLRRGELVCITDKDLNDDNILSINKDLVLNKDNVYEIKNSPKTNASNRRILIPSDLANKIREQGYVFNGNPHTINETLHKLQDQLGIPRFRLHILRHFAAAYLLKQGFTTQQVESYMGWEHGSSIMQRVYAYNLDPQDSQKEIATSFETIL